MTQCTEEERDAIAKALKRCGIELLDVEAYDGGYIVDVEHVDGTQGHIGLTTDRTTWGAAIVCASAKATPTPVAKRRARK